MRRLWDSACGFKLNGEVDKSRHALLSGLGLRLATPDFLVHTPGAMAGNHAITEVKHSLNAVATTTKVNTARSEEPAPGGTVVTHRGRCAREMPLRTAASDGSNRRRPASEPGGGPMSASGAHIFIDSCSTSSQVRHSGDLASKVQPSRLRPRFPPCT